MEPQCPHGRALQPIDHGKVLRAESNDYIKFRPPLIEVHRTSYWAHVQSLEFCALLVQWAKEHGARWILAPMR